MYLGADRRKKRRINVNFFASFKVEGPEHISVVLMDKEIRAMTLDLCEGGVTLIAGRYVPTGSRLKIKFITNEMKDPNPKIKEDFIVMEGKILTVTPLAKRKYRLGISFGVITEEVQSKFFDLICSPVVQL